MSKPVILLLAAVLIGSIVLAVSIRGQLAEKRQLEENFSADQKGLARAVAADLEREWEDLAEDGRLVAAIVAQAGTTRGNNSNTREGIFDSFRALATVVRSYKSVTFVPRASSTPISAIDPSERADMARWLLNESMRMARPGGAQSDGWTDGPVRTIDGRQFLFHATTAGEQGSVVLAVDTDLLLQRVLRLTGQDGRWVLLDHADGLWVDCGTAPRCVRKSSNEWRIDEGLVSLVGLMREGTEGVSRTGHPVAKVVGIAGSTALVAWRSFKAHDKRWTVAMVVSPDALVARERTLVRRLALTSLALAFFLGGMGLIGIRLQRRQSELQARVLDMQRQAHVRERSDRIFNSMPVGIIGIGANERVVSVNRFVLDKLGPVKVGLPIEDAFPSADQAQARKLRGLIEEASHHRQQVIMRRPDVDGFSLRPGQFEIRVVPIEDPTGEISALVLIEDLSEIRSLERRLLRAEKLATLGVLTAGLAHEIGTPLGIIRVRAETLLENIPPAEARNLASIIDQIDRIAAIIRQLLDFSREQPVAPRPTDVYAVARTVGDLLDWRLRQKQLRLETVAERAGLWVAADPDQLQQVLVNLLVNACDACAEAGHIVIRVAGENSGEQFVRIEVEDDGCGIPPEHLNAVFDPFFTTKKRGEGTGLGLPVVASIVRNHGGQIAISSEPNCRTKVAILWPAAKEGLQSHE